MHVCEPWHPLPVTCDPVGVPVTGTVQPPKQRAWCGGSAVRAGLLLADGLSHSWCASPVLRARSRDQHQFWGLSVVAFLFCISWLLEPALAVLELAS